MRWQIGVTLAAGAVILASAIGPAAARAGSSSSGVAASARPLYTVKIVEMDRNGGTVDDGAAAVRVAGGHREVFAYANRGVLTLPAGTYVIAANIQTFGAGNQEVSETLAAVTKRVNRNMTIRFDARAGKAVVDSLAVPGAVEQDRTGTVCARVSVDYVAPVRWAGPLSGLRLSSVIPLYAVPVTGQDLQFNYASEYAAAGRSYFLNWQSVNRIPARPRFTFRRADLAKVTVEAKTGATEGGPGRWEIDPGSSCNDYGFILSPGVQRSRLTQYVSAGPWTASYLAGNSGNDSWLRRYTGRRSYLDVFGAAVVGPIRSLPFVEFSQLAFETVNLFGDPNQSGSECCATVHVRLASRGKVLKQSTLGTFGQFTDHIRHAGWYQLTVSAKRVPPSGVAAAALSTKVTVSWRTHIANPASLIGALPVSLATFVPQGLDMANRASPAGRTVTRLYLDRTGSFGFPPPPLYALRTVGVAMSVNGGRSWRGLPVVRNSGYWAVTIPDPAGGFVSLRATVTDVRGNSTVETIYRAYAIG